MKKVDLKCPTCGQDSIFLTLELQGSKLGDFSLAGMQVKFSMKEVPVLICDGEVRNGDRPELFEYTECSWRLVGTIEDGQAVFQRP